MSFLFEHYSAIVQYHDNKIYKVVKKVWGWEIWIANREFCGKLLLVKKGYRCSLHFHKNKDETFHVLEGRLLFEVQNSKMSLGIGSGWDIAPKIVHRFSAYEDSVIIEFSTHHENEDSYRVEGQLSGKFEE